MVGVWEVLWWALAGLAAGGLAGALDPGRPPSVLLGVLAGGLAGALLGGCGWTLLFGSGPASFLGAVLLGVPAALFALALLCRADGHRSGHI